PRRQPQHAPPAPPAHVRGPYVPLTVPRTPLVSWTGATRRTAIDPRRLGEALDPGGVRDAVVPRAVAGGDQQGRRSATPACGRIGYAYPAAPGKPADDPANVLRLETSLGENVKPVTAPVRTDTWSGGVVLHPGALSGRDVGPPEDGRGVRPGGGREVYG